MKLHYSDKNMRLFWMFMNRRHNIFLNSKLGKRLPVADDQYMDSGYFTNVFRDLDAVTVWFAENVLPKFEMHPFTTNLLNTILFRQINNPDSFAGYAYPWVVPHDMSSIDTFRRRLQARKEDGLTVFGGAYVITNGGRSISKIDYVMECLHDIAVHIESFGKKRFENMYQFHRALGSFDGIGGFIGYEIACDLAMHDPYGLEWRDYVWDLWANPGPGARRGLKWLLSTGGGPAVEAATNIECKTFNQTAQLVAAMQILRAKQNHFFSKYGLAWQGPELDIRAIEHSLCEFSKYMKMRENIRPKRYYGGPTNTGWRVAVEYEEAYRRLKARLKSKSKAQRAAKVKPIIYL